ARPAAAGEARGGPDHAPAHRHRLERRLPLRAGVRVTVSLADVLPGVPSANLAQVSEWVVGVAMLTTASGVVGQRLLARRSIGLQVALVTVVTVVTAIASVAVISVCCLSLADRQVMLELM